jgi:hypothetical protein
VILAPYFMKGGEERMTAVLEPEEGPRTAERQRQGFWARVRRALKPAVVVAQLVYYAVCVWREL